MASDFRSPLDRWLWANRRTARWLAGKLGVHESTISRLRNGAAEGLSDELLDEIKKLTGLKRL